MNFILKGQLEKRMSSNAIPEPLRDLLGKLVFLSMIEKNKKPCMHDMTFVRDSSWLGALKRSLRGEGRKSMILHIHQIIDLAIASIDEYRDTEFLPLILNRLAEAKVGITNLITTYRRYPDTIAKISVCLDNINIQLEKNKHLLKGHTPMTFKSQTSVPAS